MNERPASCPRLRPTPLQVALAAQDEIYLAVRECLSPREQEAFFDIAARKLSRETRGDTDWDSERRRPS